MKTEKSPSAKRPIKVYSHAKRRRKDADLRQCRYEALSTVDREARDARLKQDYDDRVPSFRSVECDCDNTSGLVGPSGLA